MSAYDTQGGYGGAGPSWGAEGAARSSEAQAPPALPLAGFGRRLGAYLLDSVLISVIAFVVALGAVALSGVDVEDEAAMAQLELRLQALVFVGAFVYHWVWNSVGWSPGKMALGLRIVCIDGLPPGSGRGFIRTLGSLLSGAALGLGYLWAAWDRDTQTWHDKMAKTYVVVEEPGPPVYRSNR